MNSLNMTGQLKEIYEKYFRKYEDILNIINLRKNKDNITEITQREIANELNISSALVSKCLIRLERSDNCIEKIRAGVYKIHHTDLIKYGPFNKFLKYLVVIVEDKNVINLKFKEQAEILKMSEDEIKMVRGYIQLFEI